MAVENVTISTEICGLTEFPRNDLIKVEHVVAAGSNEHLKAWVGLSDHKNVDPNMIGLSVLLRGIANKVIIDTSTIGFAKLICDGQIFNSENSSSI